MIDVEMHRSMTCRHVTCGALEVLDKKCLCKLPSVCAHFCEGCDASLHEQSCEEGALLTPDYLHASDVPWPLENGKASANVK